MGGLGVGVVAVRLDERKFRVWDAKTANVRHIKRWQQGHHKLP